MVELRFFFFLFFKRDISVNIIARAKQKKYQQIKFRVDRVKGGSNYVRDGQRNEREAYSEFVLRFFLSFLRADDERTVYKMIFSD